MPRGKKRQQESDVLELPEKKGVKDVTKKRKAIIKSNSSENKGCYLEGKWKNELGSTAEFACKDGQINGKYMTAVGKASGYYKLTGSYTLSGPNNDVIVASWVVTFNNSVYGNSESSCTWNGIFYPDEGVLYTQWILVRYAERKDLWQSSRIGHDEFKKLSD
ncbi:hypothetical protein ACF0H5_017393 [Mactra antiquata]